MTGEPATVQLTPKDYASDQDVRWCPGCGDYSILAQTKKVMAKLGLERENTVLVSGTEPSSIPMLRWATIANWVMTS